MTHRRSSLLHDPALPGTGRLSILAAGFYFAGFVAGLDALAVAASAVVTRLQWTPPAHAWLVIGGAVGLATACSRAGWLLDHRRRPTVALAMVAAFLLLASLLTDAGSGLLAFAGLAAMIAASVWRYLE